jgi:hypothetical protein
MVVDTVGIAKIALMGRREQTKKWKCPNSDRHKGGAVASCRGVYHKIASRVDHFGMPIVSQLYVQETDVEKHASKGEKKKWEKDLDLALDIDNLEGSRSGGFEQEAGFAS